MSETDAEIDVDLRRSQLTTPASSARMMASAADSDADEVILDLEDSVAPDEKAGARESLIEALCDHEWGETLVSVRINGLATEWWDRDLATVVAEAGECLDDVVVPKVRRPGDVHAVEALLSSVERRARLTDPIGLEVQIEDGEGMTNAPEVATASDRLDALIFGPGDYTAAVGAGGLTIGGFPDYPGHYWHYALSRLVHAAKAAGIRAIDGPYADLDDVEGFRTACRRASALGCDGKWTIHPTQIEPANEAFAPSREEAERARRIVDAYEDARAAGRGAVEVDGEMVDEATHRMARTLVVEAELAGVLDRAR